MNRRDKAQRRKDKRRARQVHNRTKTVEPLIGQIMTEHADKRCPACEGGPREKVSCEYARTDDPLAHADFERDNPDETHVHLLCEACGAIGYLIMDQACQ
jgi:hypothetical protein